MSISEIAPPPETPSLPPVNLCAYSAPKEGNTEEQYEDGWAHSRLDGSRFTVALSDGASSAVFAREWAGLLTRAWLDDGFPPSDADASRTVQSLAQTWLSQVKDKATSWHAQEKLQSGSAATLLVVTWDRNAATWSACALGDVCVFLVRSNKLKYAFPLTKSSGFDDRPTLISTQTGGRVALPSPIRYLERYEPGDRFLLMTDALSQWFLTEYEGRRKPWNQLPPPDGFADWLKTERDAGRLKNDDVTLLDFSL